MSGLRLDELLGRWVQSDQSADVADLLRGRLADPQGRAMDENQARIILGLHLSEKAQTRLDRLAEKNAEGQISPTERSEYEAVVAALSWLSVLQATAHARLLPLPMAA